MRGAPSATLSRRNAGESLPADAGSAVTSDREAMHGEIIHELIAIDDGLVPLLDSTIVITARHLPYIKLLNYYLDF